VVALAESALAAPAASFSGEEFYPELTVEATVPCSHLVRNACRRHVDHET
jgi:hypothetical protein